MVLTPTSTWITVPFFGHNSFRALFLLLSIQRSCMLASGRSSLNESLPASRFSWWMMLLWLRYIPFFQTSSFMISDPTKFSFFGSIPNVMLDRVPSDNAIVNEYRKLPVSGARLLAICQKDYKRQLMKQTSRRGEQSVRAKLVLLRYSGLRRRRLRSPLENRGHHR